MSAGLLYQLGSLSTGNEGATDGERKRHQSIQLEHQGETQQLFQFPRISIILFDTNTVCMIKTEEIFTLYVESPHWENNT